MATNNNPLGNFSSLLNTPAGQSFTPSLAVPNVPTNVPNYIGTAANAVGSFFSKPPVAAAPSQSFNQAFPIFGQLANTPTTNFGGLTFPSVGTPQAQNSPVKVSPTGAVIFNPATGSSGTTGSGTGAAASSAASASAATNKNSAVFPAPLGSTAAATGNTYQTPNGGVITTDQSGGVQNYQPSPGFNIDTSNINSAASSGNVSMNDLQNQRSGYADYLQGLYKATLPSQDYLDAMKQYQDAKQMQMQIQADYLTNPGYAGDTVGFAQGVQGRQTALNALQQNAAANALNVQQTIRQGNIDAYSALATGTKPVAAGIGTSLVDPSTGQATYQSNYLYKPTAGSIDTVAQQLLQSGQATNYSDAYNMAQTIVSNSAQGQQGFAAGTGTPSSSSPVYQNAMTLLSQGVPFNQVLSSTGRSSTGRAMAQLALSDFLQHNGGYNAQQAVGNAKAATDLAAQSASVSRALDAADSNFQLLLNVADKAGINDNNSPIKNQLQNALSRKVIGDGDINQFDTGITTLRTEYAQVLARGGTVTDSVRGEANALIPDDISLDNLNKVYAYIRSEGGNVTQSYTDQINKLTNPVGGGGPTSPGGTSGAGAIDVSAYGY